MNYQIEFDAERNLVTVVFTERVGAEASIAAMTAVFTDARYRPGMDAMTVYSEAAGDWSLAELDRLRRFIAGMRQQVGRSNWAVVIPEGKSTRSARLLVALHNAFDTLIRIKIFRSCEAAMEWLETLAPTAKSV